ncbi:DoxX family protein [Arenicella sp. 4NH20-0111]|uniref:DoxX family protein n=1 Tax=Arenicella sp. 4NH20-0111 TaxID=3127648 RepID=UPI003109DEA3
MKHSKSDLASLIIRASLGTILLSHGLLKLLIFTPAGTVAFFESLGLPSIIAYLTISGEVALGVALILGILTRISAALSLPILFGASWVHASNGWLFSNQGGGWEFPVLLIVLAVSVIVRGNDDFNIKTVLKNGLTL